MWVRDRMRRDVVTVAPDTSLEEAWDLMRERGVRHLPVVRRKRLVGILTDRDVRAAWPSSATTLLVGEVPVKLAATPVREAMTSPVITVTPGTLLTDAARLMQEKKIGALPVVEDGELVGILTESDLVETLITVLPEAAVAA